MAGYTTEEKLAASFGAERLKAIIPDYTPTTGTIRITEMISSASGYIDSYLAEGGFLTPVIFADIADAEAATRLEELLSDVCIAIATGRVSPMGTRGVGRGVEKSADWAQAWLERVATGRVAIPGLTLKSRSRIQVVGENTPALPSSLFDTYRAI